MSTISAEFPRQVLSSKSKGTKWRKSMMDWASSKTFSDNSTVRNTVMHKKLNYDLVNGKIHMQDIASVIDPDNARSSILPDNIQHYPIINAKINLLCGEEFARVFNPTFTVTNPESVTEVEKAKRDMVLQRLQSIVESEQDEDAKNQALEELSKYTKYEWQDYREVTVNALMHHYSSEYDFHTLFNDGFKDALIVAEELYMADIVGGEPILEKLDPLKVRTFMSGRSKDIEDADIIIIEDYWSPSKVVDYYHDQLTKKDLDYLLDQNNFSMSSLPMREDGTVDETYAFKYMRSDELSAYNSTDFFSVDDSYNPLLAPFDIYGNVRVIRMFWKSKRLIKKVKRYDPMTGEEDYEIYDETYIPNTDAGEEVQNLWINEAWEGTKLGEEVYVNIRPRIVQYNSVSNPSRCHFGIVGSIYNINSAKPYSLVDMMKPYSYLYDVIHDRLNKAIAKNWGKIIELDLGKIPDGWEVDKWLYYAQVNGLAIVDSRNVINEGPATGKLVASLNNASRGVLDADWGDNIQQYINLLEYIKGEMSEVVGITKQREGQIQNRETVGGVERSTLQSSHITETYFIQHEAVKKKALEAFIETAKAAMKGGSKKFEYILPDYSKTVITVDGDAFAENDYGIVVDNSTLTQKLNQNIEQIAQIALQSQTINFSTVLKLYTSASIAEKMRMIETSEEQLKQQQQQMQEQQLQAQQEQAQLVAQQAEQKMQMDMQMNQENNETKILVAQIQAQARIQDDNDGIQEPNEMDKQKLQESIRQFDEKLKLDRDRLNFDKDKAKTDAELKRKQINKSKIS